MTLTVTVLGCSGSYARAGDACSGYLARTDSTTVWFDCGPGTFANMQSHVDPTGIDAVVVSHHHPDHCVELPIVYNAYRYYIDAGRITVHATAGVRDMCNSLAGDGDTSDVFDWHIVADGAAVTVGDLDIRFSRTDHPVETLAVWVSDGNRSFVYTSDTGPGWPLASLPPADLVIGEATMLNSQEPMGVAHMSGRQLGRSATDARAGRVMLTHVPPTDDPDEHLAELRDAFAGPVELAVTGTTTTV